MWDAELGLGHNTVDYHRKNDDHRDDGGPVGFSLIGFPDREFPCPIVVVNGHSGRC